MADFKAWSHSVRKANLQTTCRPYSAPITKLVKLTASSKPMVNAASLHSSQDQSFSVKKKL